MKTGTKIAIGVGILIIGFIVYYYFFKKKPTGTAPPVSPAPLCTDAQKTEINAALNSSTMDVPAWTVNAQGVAKSLMGTACQFR